MSGNSHFILCALYLCLLVLCSFGHSSCYTSIKQSGVASHKQQLVGQQKKQQQFFRSMRKSARVATKKKAASLDVAADAPTKTENQQTFDWRKSLEVTTYLGLWYLFSGYYNIYNKKALNMLKLPW